MEFNEKYLFSKAMEYDGAGKRERAIAYLSAAVFCTRTADMMKMFIQYLDSAPFDEYGLELENISLVQQAVSQELYEPVFQMLSFMMFDDTYTQKQFKDVQSTWCSNDMITLYKLIEVTLCERNDKTGSKDLTINRLRNSQEKLDFEETKKLFLKLQLLSMRVWYVPEKQEQLELVQFCMKEKVSVELLAVILKYSIAISDAADVFSRTADLFKGTGDTYYSNGLNQYVMVFAGIAQKTGAAFPVKQSEYEDCRLRLRCIYLDCNGEHMKQQKDIQKKNSHKLAIIICSNEEDYMTECLLYISRQKLPQNYKVDVIVVQNAKSMCQGYNCGMAYTDALYKVYMHHDTFLVNDRCLFMTIQKLQEQDYGMIGIAGTVRIPDSKVWWEADTEQKIYSLYQNVGIGVNKINSVSGDYVVEAIDGVYMATKQDIRWREELFTGWHFYDVAQCQEYHKAGLSTVVVVEDEPWLWHKLTMTKGYLKEYNKYRDFFIQEYK